MARNYRQQVEQVIARNARGIPLSDQGREIIGALFQRRHLSERNREVARQEIRSARLRRDTGSDW